MLKHPYHLVDLSPWPILLSFTLLSIAFNFINIILFQINNFTLFLSLLSLFFIFFQWWRDILRESKGGYHTLKVQKGILIGFLLF